MLGICLATDLEPRACMQAASTPDGLVVIGTGQGPNGVSSKMYLVDKDARELATIRAPDIVHPRQNYAMCPLQSRRGLFLHGGSNPRLGCLNDSIFFFYLYATGTTLRASRVRLQNHVICPRQLHSCCSIGDDFVFLAGGRDKSYAPLYDAYVIDIRTGYCHKIDTTIPDELTDFSLVYYLDSIWLIGGLIGGKVPSSTIYEYHLDHCTWTRRKMPRPRYRHMSFIWRGCLIIIFGFTEGDRLARDVVFYNIEANAWTSSSECKLPVPGRGYQEIPHRYSCAGTISGDNIFIYGGLDRAGNFLSDLWVTPLYYYELACGNTNEISSTTPELVANINHAP
ncbi:putative galactose oxidase/ central domain protein [Giardia duodenalis assemblage B]|uniref:Uncharacterized protein n=3 Tax=Giardia intestinalis TaxID=5741 RepID=C6LVT6_GIAIB|nr:Hypothetical protein GL50581_2894 [Giardia intestinalis ATCC 50581]ESU44438.1 Putative galactose oxidase, central domain protein [Giardia intestinalis]KWX13409.1 putative galactose oxidase/ central domain protein [Giardia intestinalis assemblage B]